MYGCFLKYLFYRMISNNLLKPYTIKKYSKFMSKTQGVKEGAVHLFHQQKSANIYGNLFVSVSASESVNQSTHWSVIHW